jgi:hypothetical protein
MIDPAEAAASTVQGEAVSIGPAVEADSVIWTVRLRTGRVVTFRASDSRAFRAAALIDSAAAVDSAVIVLVVEDSVAAVIDLAAAGLAGLAGSAAVAGSEVGAENECLEFPDFISRKAQTTNQPLKGKI